MTGRALLVTASWAVLASGVWALGGWRLGLLTLGGCMFIDVYVDAWVRGRAR